jgi:murein DD-endopeptidase MepM/ murein hydrolase activator NlpD
MAVSSAAAAALKKLAAGAATDKRVAKAVGTVIAVAAIALISPILVILALLQSGSQLDFPALAAQSKNEQLQYFEQVMRTIADEIATQNLQIDPILAQIVYLCALQGREKDDNFYSNYITCFANSQAIFDHISETFGVTFTPQDIERIEQLTAMAQASQKAPPNGIHAKIAALTKDDPTPSAEGVFLSPLHDRDWRTLVTSGFGIRVHPMTGERTFHTGLDFGVAEGTKIYAAKPGNVLLVGNQPEGYGLYVVVYHGGGEATLYGHCSRILVSEGDKVSTEMVVALSGNTGQSTGPHLHFEIVRNGVPENPKKQLRTEN